MTDAFANRLSEYLDGELSPAERSSVEAHLADCHDCQLILDDLRRVVARAAVVQDAAPPRDLWAGIATRIGTRSDRPASLFSRILTSRLSFTFPQLAAASLALMLLSGGLVWLAKSGDPRADFQPLSADTHAPGVEVPLSYDETVAQLEKALQSRRTNLDPDRLRALDEQVAEADKTIDACRRALITNPADGTVQAQLATAQQRKLSLLRAALSEASRR